MKVTALALMLIVAPTDVMAGPFCKDSPMQLCKMMCPPTNCPRGHCAMRQGRCCSMKCQPMGGTADKGEYTDGGDNDGPTNNQVDPGQHKSTFGKTCKSDADCDAMTFCRAKTSNYNGPKACAKRSAQGKHCGGYTR